MSLGQTWQSAMQDCRDPSSNPCGSTDMLQCFQANPGLESNKCSSETNATVGNLPIVCQLITPHLFGREKLGISHASCKG